MSKYAKAYAEGYPRYIEHNESILCRSASKLC